MASKQQAVIVPLALSAALEVGLVEYKFLYAAAPTGWGKTAAVRRYFQNRPFVCVSAWEEDALDRAEDCSSGLLILDDCHALADVPPLQERMVELLRRTSAGDRVVLLGRGPLPEWLLPFRVAGLLGVVPETVFQLAPGDVAGLAAAMGVELSQADAVRLCRESQGHPLAAKLICLRLAEGEPLTTETVRRGYEQLFRYLDRRLARDWDSKMMRRLLSVSFFERFTLELAKIVTGDARAGETLERLARISGFLDREGDTWAIRYAPFRDYLRRKAEAAWSAQEVSALYANAGAYYQLRGDLPAALDCYARNGSHAKVSELLVEHSRLHPGHGSYYQLRSFYRSLPEEEILASPELMSGMSVLCSLTFDVEGAERWYKALRDYAGGLDRRSARAREVRGLVSYLDIALPHRGSLHIWDILLAAFRQLRAGSIRLPEFSVTSNLPSLLRGGKDFSSWVPRDREAYRLLSKPVEALLGRAGVGLPDVALAESFYEKGEDISGSYLTLASRRLDIQQRGTPELEFVLTALLVKCLCDRGEPERAVRDLRAFYGRMEEAGQKQLLPNLRAMLCRLDLLTGGPFAHLWFVEEAPDENDFFVMERYRYLTKVRCYLRRGEYLAALALLGRLVDYFQRYDRTLDRIEALALLAICRRRMEEGDWKEHLGAALALAEPYGYVTVFAHQGAALLPLLRALPGGGEYRARVNKAVRAFAARYPDYLSAGASGVPALTRREWEVLRLMGRNRTNEEIREILSVSENTLKTHIRNLFKKLDVTSRAGAISEAVRLGLL